MNFVRLTRCVLTTAAASLCPTDAVAQLNLLADLLPGSQPSNPRDFFELDGRTLFLTAEYNGPARLWRTNGTTQSTREVATLGTFGSPRAFVLGSRGVLVLGSNVAPLEIWRTDGTASGTQAIETIGTEFGRIDQAHAVGGRVFFVHEVFAPGSPRLQVLHATDGQLGGTVRLGEFLEIGELLVFDDEVVFLGRTLTEGRELWRSDGTVSGTQMLVDLAPGAADGLETDPIAFRGRIYFVKRDGQDDDAVWISDGTAAGTREFARVFSLAQQIELVGGATDFVFLRANHGGSYNDYHAIHRLDGTTRYVGVEERLHSGFEFRDRLLARGSVQGANGLYELDETATSPRFLAALGTYRPEDETLVSGSRRVYLTSGGQVWLTGTDVPTIPLNQDVSGASDLTIIDRSLYCTGRTTNSLWEPYVGPVGAYAIPAGSGVGSGLRVPELRSEDPLPGATITISLRDATPDTPVGLAVGFHPPAPLSLDRDATIYVDPNRSTTILGRTDATAHWSTTVQVPDDPSLIGLRLTLQALVQGSPSPRGYELSNGLVLRIGR